MEEIQVVNESMMDDNKELSPTIRLFKKILFDTCVFIIIKDIRAETHRKNDDEKDPNLD